MLQIGLPDLDSLIEIRDITWSKDSRIWFPGNVRERPLHSIVPLHPCIQGAAKRPYVTLDGSDNAISNPMPTGWRSVSTLMVGPSFAILTRS
jgi:hypothetical protein